MKQSAILYFESDAFVDAAGSDKATNPGIFGEALAHWLSQQLVAEGSQPGVIIPEDFGWCVPLASRPCKLYVACSSVGASVAQWQVFVFAEGSLFARLRGKDQSTLIVADIFMALKRMLQQSSQVRALREEAT